MGTATDYSISSLTFRLDTLEQRLREETDSRRTETKGLRELHYRGMQDLRELHYEGTADLRRLHYDGMKDLRNETSKLQCQIWDLELRITTRTGIGLIIVEILVIMILASRS